MGLFDRSRRDEDDGSATRTLLRLVQDEPAEAHSPHQEGHEDEGEEHEEHIDERWLVSYADMMTLLFGLFVMLYSMANKFEAIQKDVAKQFSKPPEEKVVQAETPKIDPAEHEKLRQELEAARAKLQEMDKRREDQNRENMDLGNKSTSLNLELMNLKLQMTQKNEELERLKEKAAKALVPSNPKPEPDLTQFRVRIASLEQEKRQKDEELRKAQDKLAQLSVQKRSMVSPPTPPGVPKEKHEAIVEDFKAKITTLEEDRTKKDREIDVLKAKLAKSTPVEGGLHESFLAVIIQWPSNNHDIDLIVKDPQGKTFDFKRRKVPGHPGQFSMDTRRGPGAELWQSERIIPGTYKFTYLFYNDYGNSDPAEVSGMIFTSKGNFPIPVTNMKIKSKNKVEFLYQIKADGSVIAQ